MTQTTVQKSQTIRFGSGILEVGPDEGSLVNLGAIKNAKFTEDFDPVTVDSDNAGPVYVGLRKHTATIEADLMEINFENLYAIRGGVDTYTEVAATPVAITNEYHKLTGTNAERLIYAMGNGSEVTSITVKDSSNTSAVRNTDFVITVGDDGYTYIARVSGSTVITTGEVVTVNYTYTPNASVTLSSGGKYTFTDIVAKITNTNEDGEDLSIQLYKAYINNGMEIEFPSDDDDSVAVLPLKIVGIRDTTRTAGDQLFKIVDEQWV